MSFAEPGWFVLLPLVALFVAVAAGSAWLHRRRLSRLLSDEMLRRVLPASVRGRRLVRDAFVALALLLAIVALAEPRFDKQVRTVKATGTDIVVLLDLSRSMDARDVDPSRLERARREIHDLGRTMEADRVGLVVFAGGAFARLPLTQDFKAVELVVSEASTDTFDAQGSNLGAAIRVGLDLLSRSQDDSGQALLVLSDGETHQPDEALAAAGEAASAGVPIYAMGIGVEAAPIPLEGGRWLEWQGEVVRTQPDFEILEQTARLTGGAFVTSNAADRDIASLYQELRRSVKATERASQQRETWRSAFQWPLGLSALLLLLSAWLGDGRRAFGAATAALLAVSLLGAPEAHAADPLLEADQLYREGKYPQAAEKLVELTLLHPEDPALLERLAAARYRAGDFEGAARAFETAAELRGDEGTDDLFGGANAHYQAGRLEDAKATYERVLERDPDHPGAKANHELVSKELEARRAQRPPPPPKPDQGQQQGEGGQGDEQQPAPGQQDQQQQGPGQGGEPEGEPGSESGEDPQAAGPGGDPQESGQDPQGQGGSSEQGPEDGPSSSPVDPSQLDPTAQDGSSEVEGGGPGEPGGEAGPITAGQAERLLESIDEGTPRTVVAGRPEGKPW